MSETQADRNLRANERSTWPIRRYTLVTQPDEDLIASTSGEERLSMMWELARQAWLLTGQPFPEYDRQSIPGRIIRPDP